MKLFIEIILSHFCTKPSYFFNKILKRCYSYESLISVNVITFKIVRKSHCEK